MQVLVVVAILITLSSVQGLLWGSKGSDKSKRSDRWISLREKNKNLTEKIEHYIHLINTKVGGDGIYFSGIYREEGESDQQWFGHKNRFYKAAQISELAANSMSELHYSHMTGPLFSAAKSCFQYTTLYLDGKESAVELLTSCDRLMQNLKEYKPKDWGLYLKELREYYSKFKNREGLLKVIRKGLTKAFGLGFLFLGANLFLGGLSMLALLGVAGLGWKMIIGAFSY